MYIVQIKQNGRSRMNKIMKRLSVFLVVVLCLTAFPYRATAATDGIVAGDIKWGENHSGTIAGTPVIYNFSLKQSGKVAVTFTFSDSNVNNYRFVIRDKAGNNLVYEHVGNGTYTVSADLLAGDYEIAMWQYVYWNVDLNYSFVPFFQASGETVNEVNTNKNNEVTCASSYTLKQNRKGQFAINDDTDIYKVVLKKNGILRFTVNSQVRNMDIVVQNAMDDVSYREYGVQMGKHVYSYFCPKGTYYITLSSNQAGTYSFNASLTDIPAVSLKKATNVKTKSMLVKWNRNSSVMGYQVQYSTNSKFAKDNRACFVSNAKMDGTTLYSLKAKKKYYVRVRTYITDKNGKKYYSKWSNVKNVVIKK